MANKEIATMGSRSFEDLDKRYGAEYWSAKKLQLYKIVRG